MLPQLHADVVWRVLREDFGPSMAGWECWEDPSLARSRSSRVACKFVWIDR
jgi:hypothetical protein